MRSTMDRRQGQRLLFTQQTTLTAVNTWRNRSQTHRERLISCDTEEERMIQTVFIRIISAASIQCCGYHFNWQHFQFQPAARPEFTVTWSDVYHSQLSCFKFISHFTSFWHHHDFTTSPGHTTINIRQSGRDTPKSNRMAWTYSTYKVIVIYGLMGLRCVQCICHKRR